MNTPAGPASVQKAEPDPPGVVTAPDDRGTKIDTVFVVIDYAIVEHFSKHLYGSPNKAVEELVTNAYDAWATHTFVYTPGRFSPSALLVWDNGDSMDVSGLHKLWWIAKSPKENGTDRIESRGGESRPLIGKFGIGKLASYSLGHRITHLCRRGAEFLRITVDYRAVPHLEEGHPEPRYPTPVMKLTEAEAKEYLRSLTRESPAAEGQLWHETHWTLSVVDELRPDVHLTPGRLRWVLGNGMPLRPDFKVFVDDEEVLSRLGRDASTSWDLSEIKLQAQIRSDWKSARAEGHLTGDPEFVPDPETGESSVVLPSLGSVRAQVRLFRESLLDQRASDLGRSHGFFIMVRGRLLNPDDALFLLHIPSFGTFNRSQFVIQADGLDADLLADRERLQRDSPKVRELNALQSSLYLAARQELEAQDASTALARLSESLLPVDSREYFQEPLTALLLANDAPAAMDTGVAHIERRPLTSDQPIARIAPEGGGFSVNTSHPLFAALAGRLGTGIKAREALRAYDLIAVADVLLEGHLYDIGFEPERIVEVLAWRDGLLRSIAARLSGAQEEVVHEVREASYAGDKAFEIALGKVFEAMGFATSRDGRPGHKDVLVVAPIGPDAYKFTLEAKGSVHAVDNGDGKVASAAAHAKAVGAQLAVIVARDFAGFERPQGRPAILQECDRQSPPVAIAALDTLVELFQAVRTYSYPLDMILPVLEVIEAPEDKLQAVRRLEHPTEDFDFRAVLHAIWEQQLGRASGDLVAYRTIMQSRDDWKALGFKEFTGRLVALQTLSRGLVLVARTREAVFVKQHPDLVAEQIQRSVAERLAPTQTKLLE